MTLTLYQSDIAMRSAGYQDSSARCWCCRNSRPFYSALIVITTFVLLSIVASLSFGGYYIYTKRGNWIDNYRDSQNYSQNGGSNSPTGTITMDQDYSYEDTPDGPHDITPLPESHNDVPDKRTRTKFPDISDEEIKAISSQLWALDRQNQIPPNSYEINAQAMVNITEKIDRAPEPLFTRMDINLQTRSLTFTRFIALLDNYNPQVKIAEETTEEERQEIEMFIDALIQTRVIQALYQFLVEKRYLSSDQQSFRTKLKEMWFGPYSRSSKYNATDSSGFEHVFVGEMRGKVTGFHSWIQYYLQEKAGNINYYGYLHFTPAQPWLINIQLTWLDKFKKETSFFVGTNPEFDFAIYTLCILTRRNRHCELNINGLHPKVLTYDINHVPGLQFGTAFPAI